MDGPLTQMYSTPAAQPVYAEPYSDGYAQDLQDAARRAYEAARTASFGARGELSRDLDAIDPTQDFNYSPAAVKYMQDVGNYLSSNQTGYDLTPMNVGTSRDRQTGAMMPLTNAALEQYAASPLENQFYANFNQSKPGESKRRGPQIRLQTPEGGRDTSLPARSPKAR